MEERIVSRSDLTEFIQRIGEKRRVIAPTEDRTGRRYDEIADPSRVRLEPGRPALSPKDTVFPQRETLLRFVATGVRRPSPHEGETVLFGVRPCDARALALIDRVFRWDGIDDPYYVHRREHTTIVALACAVPGAACFCSSVGGGPADGEGSDVLMFDLNEQFLLAPRSERGEVLLAELEQLTRPAGAAHRDAARTQAEEAAALLPATTVPTDVDALRAAFDSSLWEEFSATCLGCGVCTYACPTCHCFDITDEILRGSGHRVRSWDSCAFALFTLHGSGHNPRQTKAARLRQRILHKFLYCPENFGDVFCVGCGRCITNCPTGLDLRAILDRLSTGSTVAGRE
jgi:sulfhydrogenase subunit beta (sulfur reductase)